MDYQIERYNKEEYKKLLTASNYINNNRDHPVINKFISSRSVILKGNPKENEWLLTVDLNKEDRELLDRIKDQFNPIPIRYE